MTALFIDTSLSSQIRVALFRGGSLGWRLTRNIDDSFSEMIISVVDELLTIEKQAAEGIEQVFIVEGPGRFSALRTGMATANAIAYLLDIPAVAVKAFKDDINYWREVENCISVDNIREKIFLKSLLPNYGKDPNISIKKE